jgi:hypothetical protein
LLHSGLVESHRILRARLRRPTGQRKPDIRQFIDKWLNENNLMKKRIYQRRQAMTTGVIPFRASREVLTAFDIEGSVRSAVATGLGL